MKIKELLTISKSSPLEKLEDTQVRELQKALKILGYPVGPVDGIVGPRTRTAWLEFKEDIFIPDLVGRESIEILQEKLRELQDSATYDFSTREGTIRAIREKCRAQGIGLDTQIAYVLATVDWETNKTFKPVREAYWLSEKWRRNNLRYYPYYGRGYVQITWKDNYRKFSKILEMDLIGDPDQVMHPEIALFILVYGFKTGKFTGKRIGDYINEEKTDFINARRCINGLDKAREIAALARHYLSKP